MWHTRYVLRKQELLLARHDDLEYINFRKRFRLPPIVFFRICDRMRKYGPATHTASGKLCIPLELKVLGVLRHIGRDTTCAGITGYSEETHRGFFHKFVRLFDQEFKAQWLTPPAADSLEITFITSSVAHLM